MKVLCLNQTFYPDVVSTAQHLSDLAVALADRGHEVRVLAGRRAYDDPARRFARRESWRGIHIRRIDTAGLGKSSRWRRAADFAFFLAGCCRHLLFGPRFDCLIALTSPPLISVPAALFARLRHATLITWVMDLNPDEAVAAGWLRPGAPLTRLLDGLQRWSLNRSARVIVLDRFMKQRITAKGVREDCIAVLPPWAHDDVVHFDAAGRRTFRTEHDLSDAFVVMYSGNHSPCHPLDTLLAAALALVGEAHIRFCFVGGGSEFEKVRGFAREHALSNVLCLPYQPLERLSASLSAADLHVVVLGDPFRGIVHPCKIYNILVVGAPVLYIGPGESHVTDLFRKRNTGGRLRAARHGQVQAVVDHIRAAVAEGTTDTRPATTLAGSFSRQRLLPRLIEIVEGREGRG